MKTKLVLLISPLVILNYVNKNIQMHCRVNESKENLLFALIALNSIILLRIFSVLKDVTSVLSSSAAGACSRIASSCRIIK